MEFFEYPLRAPNNFDLALMRSDMRASTEEEQDQDQEQEQSRPVLDDQSFVVKILEPKQGAVLTRPFVQVSFRVLPHG